MDSWARAWWPEKYRSLQILEDHHDWSNEAWTRVLLLLEYHQPGFALKGDNDKDYCPAVELVILEFKNSRIFEF